MGLTTIFKFTCDRCGNVYKFDGDDKTDLEEFTDINFSSVLTAREDYRYPRKLELCPECARRMLFAAIHGGEPQYSMIDSAIDNALSIHDARMKAGEAHD